MQIFLILVTMIANKTKIPPIKEIRPKFSFKMNQAKIGPIITCKRIIIETSGDEINFGPVKIRKLPMGTQRRLRIKRYKIVPVST